MALGVQTAFITGAARGMGEGVARALAARGYQVALVGLEFERLRSIAFELNSARADSALAIEADVTESAALDLAVSSVLKKFGRINVVVVNAGIANNGSFASTHIEDSVRVVNVNLNGAMRTLKSVYDALLDSRGYALLLSSASAFPSLPALTAYAASKAGVDQFANNLRLEMRPRGVDIGVAYPSFVDTDMVRDQVEDLPAFKKLMSRDIKFLGRITPLDEAVAILVEGIEQRKRRIYIPESISFLHGLRSLAVSSVWDLAMGFLSSRFLPSIDEEARGLGRSFGRSSVEAQALSERTDDPMPEKTDLGERESKQSQKRTPK